VLLAPNVRIRPQTLARRETAAGSCTRGHDRTAARIDSPGAHGVALGSTAAAKAQHPVSRWPRRAGSFFSAALRASKVWISRSTNS